MSIINLSNGVNSIKVKVKATPSGLVTSADPVVLKQTTSVGVPSQNVEDLKNVISSGEDNGDTLVFDKVLQRWVSKQLDISEITGIVDGGQF